jgi:hypothetical protein
MEGFPDSRNKLHGFTTGGKLLTCCANINFCKALLHEINWFCHSTVIAQAQKADFVFRRKGRVNLNRRGRQFSRLLAAEVCASVVVMLDTPCSEVV